METITMKDGTVVQNAYIVWLEPTRIAVYVKNMSFHDVLAIFNDPAKTVHMESDQYGDKKTWDGFTVMDAIQTQGAELVSACLHQ